MDLEVTATGTTITGSGDETLRGGHPETLDLSETIPGAGDVRVVMVAGQTYLQLPPAINPSDKPWLLISSSSSDPRVQQLAASVESVNRSSDLDQYRAFAEVATVTVVGEEQVDGVSTTHYALTVDVTRLPNDTPGRQDFLSVGILRLPVELWVDSEGRPVKVSERLAVQGQEITSVVTLGTFDEPVTITAPPADQVATG